MDFLERVERRLPPLLIPSAFPIVPKKPGLAGEVMLGDATALAAGAAAGVPFAGGAFAGGAAGGAFAAGGGGGADILSILSLYFFPQGFHGKPGTNAAA